MNIEEKTLAATWADTGKVHIWDLTRPMNAVNDSNIMSAYTRNLESPAALFTFSGHQVEGYAMDWCPMVPGLFPRFCKQMSSYIFSYFVCSVTCKIKSSLQ